MRITKGQFKRIIREEIESLTEAHDAEWPADDAAREIADYIAGDDPQGYHMTAQLTDAELRARIVDEWFGGRMEHMVTDDLMQQVQGHLRGA